MLFRRRFPGACVAPSSQTRQGWVDLRHNTNKPTQCDTADARTEFEFSSVRAADLFDRRCMLMLGIGLFTIGSTIGGFAQTAGMLSAARAVQGL